MTDVLEERVAALEDEVERLNQNNEFLRGLVKEQKERIDDIVADQVDATQLGGVDSEHQLEIQRRVSERQAGHDVNPQNLYRATFVWEQFYERAVADQGYWKLESPQVKNILDGEDLDTNPNTVKRVMKQLAKYTGPSDEVPFEKNLIQFQNGTDKNALVADRDDWEDWASQLEDDVGSPDDASEQEVEGPAESDMTANAEARADAEASALMQAEAVTDDSSDTIEEELPYGTAAEVGD